MTTSSTIGQKLWNYCDVLRGAGLSYGDYLEQLTYLIFLKMMHERTHPVFAIAARLSTAAHTRGLRLAPACWRATAQNWRPTTAARWRTCPRRAAPSA